jgi:hypothetical protein
MIVIDVFRVLACADRAYAGLQTDQFVDLGRADPVSALEVIVARSAVQTLRALFAPGVVTRLAVGVAPVLVVAVARELLEGLPLTAVGAALHGAHTICGV